MRALITLRPPQPPDDADADGKDSSKHPHRPPLDDANGDDSSSSSSSSSSDWHITEYCPFFEADRTWRSDDDDEDEGGQEQQQQPPQQPFAPLYERRQRETGRRAYNTHLRWDMMPTATAAGEGAGAEGARFLYVVRDGRDVAVSYFHHMRSMVRGRQQG